MNPRIAQHDLAELGRSAQLDFSGQELVVPPVSEFPRFNYSMKQVLRAGDALAGEIIWNDETADAVREIFDVANSWRDSHAYPMRKLRHELVGQIRGQRLTGITAARLKRMQSIRGKLRRLSLNLNQVQDLAGCRAVLPTIGDVNALIRALRENTGHVVHGEKDYIASPKPDGYRCHHMVFKFRGQGDAESYNDRRVEVQIRTRLQHSWATAVEAIGLLRGEDMKAGQGSPEWLRLFELVSAEFALAEGCQEPGDVQARQTRVAEIIALDKALEASSTLENLSQAVRYTDLHYLHPLYRPEYYLISYDNIRSIVTVQAISGIRRGRLMPLSQVAGLRRPRRARRRPDACRLRSCVGGGSAVLASRPCGGSVGR